jgi:hypothetical protein
MTEACGVCPARWFGEAGQLLTASLSEVVPPEAQRHLIAAQRELLLAVALTIEHNAARASGKPRSTPQRGAKSKRRRPSRVDLE